MYFKAGDHDSPTQICMKQFEPKAEYLMSLLCRFALGSRVFVCHNGAQVIFAKVQNDFGLAKLFWTAANCFGQGQIVLVGATLFWSGSS